MTGSATTPPPSPGRAFLVYSALRVVLLLASFLLLTLLGLEDLLAVGAAVLLSALLSLVFLRKQRDAFTAASMARADQRRAEREARRARLDEGRTD